MIRVVNKVLIGLFFVLLPLTIVKCCYDWHAWQAHAVNNPRPTIKGLRELLADLGLRGHIVVLGTSDRDARVSLWGRIYDGGGIDAVADGLIDRSSQTGWRLGGTRTNKKVAFCRRGVSMTFRREDMTNDVSIQMEWTWSKALDDPCPFDASP